MTSRQLAVLWMVLSLAVLLPGAALSAPTAQQGFASCAEVTEIPQTECEALVTLYVSTHVEYEEWPGIGPVESGGWFNEEGWLEDNQPCGWYGVTCSDGEPRRVTRLELASNNLWGILPPEIGDLTELTHLDFEDSRMGGASRRTWAVWPSFRCSAWVATLWAPYRLSYGI